MNEDGWQESKWDTQLIRQVHRELFKDKLLPEGKLTIRWSCKARRQLPEGKLTFQCSADKACFSFLPDKNPMIL